jgi:hypothetical protein
MSDSGHRQLANALRQRTLEGPGQTAPADRQRAASVAAGRLTADDALGYLAKQIGEAAYRVTDEQIASVRAITGSQKATFEIVAAAALGAGLARWEAAVGILRETTDAAR